MARQEIISGLVERVTYFNEENGFCVLKVKAKGRFGLATVVGSAAAVNAGEWLEAEGRWTQDRDHGLQFRAVSIRTMPPSSLEGIERYLASGLIKGIGPVLAERLVKEFGERVFAMIEEAPKALERVEGIGATRRERIQEAWRDARHVREIMVFLHSHGVSTSRAVRIFRTYGERAIEVVCEDPYVLARDIHGIGFKSADQIGRRLGIATDSVKRVSAGLAHLLLEALGEGHCALPRNLLVEQAIKLLEVSEGPVSQALDLMLSERTVILQEVEGAALVFLPHLLVAESEIARRLRRLADTAPRYPRIDVEKAIEWRRERSGIELAPSQKDALRTALGGRLTVITGGPGVGKTTLVSSIVAILSAKKVRCLLCAPTGRAAKRLSEATGMEAKTIHRLLEAEASGRFGRGEKNPLDCDLLIVDETSMVDVLLMSALLRACPPQAALILVGDVDQLPSVGPGMVLRDLIQSGVARVVALTEVFRQAAGSQIIRAAHSIRRGTPPLESAHDQGSDFFFLERDTPERAVSTIDDLILSRVPKHLGLNAIRDVQVLTPMNRGALGVRELNARLQRLLNPSRESEAFVERYGFRFQRRDKVIQTENNYDKEVFNGDIGSVEKVDSVLHELSVSFDGRVVTYDFDELDQLSLAYAITIHKSQGSEFPAVIVPLAMEHYVLLQRNLIYTAVTRGRRMVVVVGQKKAFMMAIRNSRVAARYGGLLQRMRGELA